MKSGVPVRLMRLASCFSGDRDMDLCVSLARKWCFDFKHPARVGHKDGSVFMCF